MSRSRVPFLVAVLLPFASGQSLLPDLTITGFNTAGVVTDTQSLQVSGLLGVTVKNAGGGAVSSPYVVFVFEDRNQNGAFDAGDVALGQATANGGLAVNAEAQVLIPVSGTVLFRGNIITGIVDYGRSIAESTEANNTTRSGGRFVPPTGVFSPALKWSWKSSTRQPDALNVMSTPAAIDLNRDGTADLVFGSTADTGGALVNPGFLRAVSGADGAELFTVDQTSPIDLRINAASSVAVGDIDGDSRPEIIACDVSGRRLIAFEHDGTFKWRSPDLEVISWGAPSIADLNNDGIPEIIVGRQVLSNAGAILWTGVGGAGAGSTSGFVLGPLSIVSDVDADGKMEVIAGNTVYGNTGAVKFRNTSLTDGLTAVANFDADAQAEIVLVTEGKVYLLEHDLTVKWGPVAIPGGGAGGAPTIADFDNDGKPEIGVAGGTRYAVFETDGSLRWAVPIQDSSSNVTGSSVFDFEGDGAAEVVYHDELNLYILKGTDGATLFKTPLSSCTWYEYPFVADVTGDGRADIVAVANNNCGFGPQRGVYVYSDATNNWVSTRSIWNQHSYHITNVNDDGTIPRNERNNWQVPGLNNFRLNTFSQPQGASGAPDYTSSLIRKNDSTFPASVRLTARVGNGGGVPGTLQRGRVVVAHDANTFGPNLAKATEGIFAVNVARWLTGGKSQPKLLIIDLNPGDPKHSFSTLIKQILTDNGFALTVSNSLTSTLAQYGAYDAIFVNSQLAGGTLDNGLLTQYVDRGGSVYIAGGVGPSANQEAPLWAQFLGSIGLAFESGAYNDLTGVTVTGSHPIFAGVSSLASDNGQDIIQLSVNQGVQLSSHNGHTIYATYDGSTASASPNLIQNGSFEAATPSCPTNVFDTRAAGHPTADSINSWKVVKADIHYVHKGYWQAADGSCSIDMDGNIGAAGAIEQSIATVPGRSYELTFQMSGNPGAEPIIKPLRVSAAGSSRDFVFDITGKSVTLMRYEKRTMTFVASSSTTIVRFESTSSPSGWGAVIDDVQVHELAIGTSSPISVSFYRGDPANGGTLIGKTQTTKALAPGEYEDVSITWNNPPAGLHAIVVVADDPAAVAELDETNNKAGANILLGIGPFPLTDTLTTRFKDTAVDLSWAPVPGAASYNLYRRSTSTGPLQLLQRNVASTRFSDSNLTNGTTYYYVVRWVAANGTESADGTEASATPTPDQRAGNLTPPTILSNPVTRARTQSRYSYQVTAGDPDPGDTLAYGLTTGPVGMTIGFTTGLIEWTPGPQQFGYSNVTVRVQDSTARFATQTFRLFVEAEIINNAPVITSSAITRGASGEPYGYRVTARDPDTGDLLTYSLTAGPSGMSINQSTGLISWTPTRQQVATHPVTVRVADLAGLSATQTFSVAVARGNKAPVFTSIPVTTARALSSYRYLPVATDPDADPLTFSLVSVAPAIPTAPITIDGPTGLLSWNVPANAASNSFDVTIRVVDDGGLAATQAFRVTVGAPNQPPVFTSTPVTSAAANVVYRYTAVASDPNLPNDALAYSLKTAPPGMTINAITGVVEWLPTAAFVNTPPGVSIEVRDLDGLTATQTFTLRVTPPDTTRPTVSSLTSLNGATLTADTPILGSVSDDNLRLWRVEYRPVDSPTWLTLTSGTTNVNNGQLGVIPATLLANDVYRLRVYAEDAVGSVTSPEIELQVDTKQLKMGDFTLSFEDLRVPGFTFPISILRRYDTKRPQSGDFGLGWTLGFSDVNVRLDVNKNAFVTLPDGRRVNFKYTPQCAAPSLIGCFLIYNTIYTASAGVQDKLENLDCPQTLSFGASALCGFDPFVANVWRLTTKEGLKYTIANGKVTRMEDRAGNWMEISTVGVKTNFGRDVTFERDSANRIVRVNEPSPGASLRYEYDAQGRLVKFFDLNGKATTFDYENASYPHYLTKITDALGRQVVRNVFNAEGRLVAQCDANGNITTLVGCTQLNPQPNTKTFNAINSRGFKTELISDDRGNILSERRYLDATNYLETIRAYDANNNMLTEKDPGGNTKTFSFDAKGNRLTETDRGGNTYAFTYNGCDKVATQRDPSGSVTTFTYDEKCYLRFVRDNLGGTSEYRYNAVGQLVRFSDPLANAWQWSYDASGFLSGLTDPFGKTTAFRFASSGRLISRTDRNSRRIEFEYDSAHRIQKETWADGRVVNYSYDAAGALVSLSDAESTLSFAYDDLGRLKSTDNQGTPIAPRLVMTNSYDEAGNVTAVSDSLGGKTARSYDGLSRLIRVSQSGVGVQEKAVDLEYDGASLLKVLRRWASLGSVSPVANTFYEYQCGGCPDRLSAIRHRLPNNSILHDLTYGRDPVGNIITMTDAEGSHTYSYDSIRRLSSAGHGGNTIQPSEQYAYDPASNRNSSHLSALYDFSYQVTGKGNRLMQDSRYTYVYDNEGNVTKKTDRASGSYVDFEYDFRNRMIRMASKSQTGALLSEFVSRYDPLNRRIGTILDGDVTWYGFDGAQVTLEIGASGSIKARLLPLTVGRILAEERSTQVRWLLLDHLGTPRDYLNNNGATLNHRVFDSFGRQLSQTSPSFSSSVGFTGHQPSAFGYIYMNARTYDPGVGRFNEEDPLRPYGYGYAGANPLGFYDPTGAFAMGEYLVTFVLSPASAFLTGTGIPGDPLDPFELVGAYAPSIPGFIGFMSGFAVSNLRFLGEFLAADQLSLADRWRTAVDQTRLEFCPGLPGPEEFKVFGGFCGGHKFGVERLERMQPR